MSSRFGAGGNPLYHFVNEGLAALRANGAAGRLDAERQQLAAEFRQLDPVARRQRLDAFRQDQAMQRQAAEQAANAGVGGGIQGLSH